MGQNFDDYPDFQQKARGDRIMNNTVEAVLTWVKRTRNESSVLQWGQSLSDIILEFSGTLNLSIFYTNYVQSMDCSLYIS